MPLPISVTDDEMKTFFNEKQPTKVLLSIVVTEEGIETSTKETQSTKALIPIIFKDDGSSKVTFFNDLQQLKAHFPKVINEDEIVIFFQFGAYIKSMLVNFCY